MTMVSDSLSGMLRELNMSLNWILLPDFCLVPSLGCRGPTGGWFDPTPFRFLCDPGNGRFGIKAVALPEYLYQGPGGLLCWSFFDWHVSTRGYAYSPN